jgi:hypothetical protein
MISMVEKVVNKDCLTDKKKFDENYDKIFGNKKGKEKK